MKNQIYRTNIDSIRQFLSLSQYKSHFIVCLLNDHDNNLKKRNEKTESLSSVLQ